jgi:phosphatidylglycerol lysyltransferase
MQMAQETSMGSFHTKRLTFITGAVLFAASLWILHEFLKNYSFHDVWYGLHEIPTQLIFTALGLTFLNYIALTSYDTLGTRYSGLSLPYRKTALAAFLGYALSQSLGFPLFTGAAIRYRLYSVWGLSTERIAQVIAFSATTFTLGALTIGGTALILEPQELSKLFHLSPLFLRPIGILLICTIAFYLFWCSTQKRPLKIGNWTFAPPPATFAFIQVVISSTEWTVAAAVLFVLLKPFVPISFPGFLAVFVLSQFLGVISHVPGGIGIFESSILIFLATDRPAAVIVGALIAYRMIYYLVPLILGLSTLAGYEITLNRGPLKRIARSLARRLSSLVPPAFALMAFIAGAVLLFSGATPSIHDRLSRLDPFLPLPVLEISHFVGSLIGISLLFLARSLQRRLDAAYVLTSILLTAGIGVSLLKGLDYEEALLLTGMLIIFLPCRNHFYRKTSLLSEPFTPGWITAIALVLFASIWLGFFSFKHVEYSNQLWWQFTLKGDAPRFLRSSVGAVGLAFCIALYNLFRSATAEPNRPVKEELDKAESVVAHTKRTYANLALLGDKALLFSRSGRSFLMYGVEGRSWIVMGDPIGSQCEFPELVWDFRRLCDRHAGSPVFYEVHPSHLPLYLDLGLTLLKLGEEARVPLETFSLEGMHRKGFRHLLNKLERNKLTFEIIPREDVSILLPEMKEISDAWLSAKNTREKEFSLGCFDPEYLKRFPAAIARLEGKMVGFVNIWSGSDKEEISLDLMRYSEDAPPGVMDYLFIRLMLWGKMNGYHWFNLGMAPLSGLQDHSLAPLWNRFGALLFRYGEHFYNFQGLRQYKEKFDPIWEPRYLASPGGLNLPRILANVASLVSGGLKGVIAK